MNIPRLPSRLPSRFPSRFPARINPRLRAAVGRAAFFSFAAVWIAALWTLHAAMSILRPIVLMGLWVLVYVTLLPVLIGGFLLKHGYLYSHRWELVLVPLGMFLAIQVYEFVLSALGHGLRASVEEAMGPEDAGTGRDR